MKIKMLYTNGAVTVAKGYRAKSILRRALHGTGFGLSDVIALKPDYCVYFSDDTSPEKPTGREGATLACHPWQIRNYAKAIEYYDGEPVRHWDWDWVSVLVK